MTAGESIIIRSFMYLVRNRPFHAAFSTLRTFLHGLVQEFIQPQELFLMCVLCYSRRLLILDIV